MRSLGRLPAHGRCIAISNRTLGRYNLHRLGWSAFEDLCMQILRLVLGETCTRFVAGPDGGRDGWYQGQAAGLLASQNRFTGNFLVQCKHTSTPHHALKLSHLKKEIEKVKLLAQQKPFHYLILTNRELTSQSEFAIRSAIESIPGVNSCLVLGEAWIEDTVDANTRLLRLVPRLYGIGDLSQILSSVIEQQTIAVLEDSADSLRTFVPTESYREAERALSEHRFVVLVGPPASGKSAIAANLCMVSSAQDPNVRVLRIEQADQFKGTWSPADAQTIYWVDDVFGETTLDDFRLREWSAALEKVEAARKRGARILFCTRDYILSAAERLLKNSKAATIKDARVRVDVTALSGAERAAILYNHIKHGDISKEQKGFLKEHLSGLARLSAFSPELARRLGSSRFHKGLRYDWPHLKASFEKPVQHFKDVIHGLSGSETAVLAVCLLSNNAVPDPVPDDALAEAVLKTYGVSMHQVREAFELLEGSLVKRVRSVAVQTWQVHHPSMIEALQEELAKKSSHLILYLKTAQIRAILRDTSTSTTQLDSRLVFLPSGVYEILIERFRISGLLEFEAIANYIATRSSDEFLVALNIACPELLDRALSLEPKPDGTDIAAHLAVRLYRVSSAELFGISRQSLVTKTLSSSVDDWGWMGFLDIHGIREALPRFVQEILKREVEGGFPSLDRLYEWFAVNLSSKDDIYAALGELSPNASRIRNAANSAGLMSSAADETLTQKINQFEQTLLERSNYPEEREEASAEYYYDEWKERRAEERYERDRFADVDE